MDDKKVLFVSSQGVGNLVAKVPAIRTFTENGWRVTILTTSLGVEVYELFCLPVKYMVTKSWSQMPKAYYDFLRKEFDCIFTAAPHNNGFFNGHKTDDMVEVQPDWGNQSEMMVNVIKACEVIGIDTKMPYYPFGSRNVGIYKVPKSIGIHMGSTTKGRWPKKRWDSEKWATLVNNLSANYKVTIFGQGSDDEDRNGIPFSYLMSERHAGWHGKISMVWNKPLDYVYRALLGIETFIGNDSGISKLATSAGAQTICLYGPTDPNKNRLHNEIALTGGASCHPCQYEHHKMESCIDQICFPEINDVLETLGAL